MAAQRAKNSEDIPEKEYVGLWLVQLSGLSAGLRTERLLVRFQVRAHVWVEGQVPGWGCARGNQSIHLSHISVSLPPL